MTEYDLQKICTSKHPKIFIFSCPVSFPVNFAIHTWVVFWDGEKYTRMEVLGSKPKNKNDYFFINNRPPTEGYRIFFFGKYPVFTSTLLYSRELDNNEDYKIIQKIQTFKKEDFLYRDTYFCLGPNSNTFTAWFLKDILNDTFKLPWRALGSNYR